ncbi:MAG: transposase [Clostridia bacterium]|nr:transposase [Clostridia bacterium]
MSRPPRVLSKTGLYHIIFRGINRQDLFEENQDYIKLLEIIEKIKEEEKFELYAYCLMTNHVHLFMKEQNMGDIKKIVHMVNRDVPDFTHFSRIKSKKSVKTGTSLFRVIHIFNRVIFL